MPEDSKPKVSHVVGGIVLLLVNLIGGWLSGFRTGGESNTDAAIYMISSAVLLPLTIVAITLIWRSQRIPRSIAKNFMLASVVPAISNYGLLFA